MTHNAVKASQIVATALTLLWDGHGLPRGKAEFGCWSITWATKQITGLESNQDLHAALSDPIHARITKYICGHDHVRAYFYEVLQRNDLEYPELQAFRKKMLEDILAEYVEMEAKEVSVVA